MVIDMHQHLWLDSYQEDKKELLCAMEHFGITRSYVSGLGSHQPDEAEILFLNQQVADFMHEHPREIGGAVYVNPLHQNAISIVRRGIEDTGMELVKLWISCVCDSPAVFPVVEAAIDLDVPILLHAFQKAGGELDGESTGVHVANLARRYPEAKLIMAHLGGNVYHGIPAIRSCKNVWTDISGTIFRAGEIAYAVKNIGADRILFGSDIMGCSYLLDLGQVLEAPLTQEEREKILWKNASRLFVRKNLTKEEVCHAAV